METMIVNYVTSLAAEANSFITIQPQTSFGSAPRSPEGPIPSHQKSYLTSVTGLNIFGTKPRTATPLTAKGVSPLGVF